MWTLDWLVCIWEAHSQASPLPSRNWLTLCGAVPLGSTGPQVWSVRIQKIRRG